MYAQAGITDNQFGTGLLDVYTTFSAWPVSCLLIWRELYELRCSQPPGVDWHVSASTTHPRLFLPLVAKSSELTDPEHRIQLHNLERDEVGEQVLGLKDTQKNLISILFNFGQTRQPLVHKELRVEYVARHTS